MLVQRPVVCIRSRVAIIVGTVVSMMISACGGGGGAASPGLTPSETPPPVAPPAQFADGTKSFAAGSDRNVALPLYGIALPFAAVVAPGSIFAGRRLESDNRVSVTFESAVGANRSVTFPASAVSPYVGVSGDVNYLEARTLGTTPTALDYVRFGTLSFTSPTTQVVGFYGGFETPTGSGPTAGTLSYNGTTGAVSLQGGIATSLVGSVQLEADFQANRVFGALNNLKTVDGSGTPTGDYDYRFLFDNVTITNGGGSRTFAGALIGQKVSDASTVTSADSIVNGRFFGNTAQEAGGVWQSDAIAGREVWGAFGATNATVSGMPTFLQSVGTALPLSERTSFEVNVISNVATAIVSAPGATVTPLASGGLTFSNAALGSFNPPGSSTSPSLSSSTPFYPATGATMLTGATTGPGVPSLLFMAERGTLSYARFGYWIDSSRVGANDVLEYSFFAGGLQTPSGAMPVSGTANYAGTSLGAVVDGANNLTTFAGRLQLTANFGTGAVSGQIDNLAGTALPLDRITLGTATISGNAFAGGTATALQGVNTVGTGTHGGRFFGPQANEVAGTYTLDAGSLQGWGSYGGSR